jgi:hypothetical protein
MKTLNLTLRTILLTLVLASTTSPAFAYDMVVKGIYYDINGNEATVTYIDRVNVNGNFRYNYYNKYFGHISIPETVTFNGLTYTVTSIGDYAFNNCTSLTSVSIPKSVTIIGKNSFNNCDALISIAIPITVTSINDQAFFDCDGLTSLSIPDSTTSIGSHTFYSCDNLTSITIGTSVTSIGINAFNETPLAYITCKSETPATVGAFAFYSYDNTTLYVPLNSIEIYKSASTWSNFKIITDFKPNYLSLDDVSTMHGDTIVVPVMMENENEITAFQTDVYLVEGFEVVKNENDEYLVELSERKGRDHVIMANETPDGAVRIASYSPTLKTYKNNEGELFYITVKVPEDGAGVYPFILKNTRLTTIDEDEVLSPDAYCNVTVAPFIKGDANESGDVTITDVVVTAKYILFQNPEPFSLEAADMNGDSKITITDVVKIANLVLDQDYEDEPAKQRMMAPNVGGDRMSGEAIGNTVSINLDNEMGYTALQMDLTLPEGMISSDFALSNRASNLALIMKDRGNGKIRLLAYSPELKTIRGNEGAVLTFNVVGSMSDIMVDRIELVNSDGESTRLSGFNITLNNNVTSVKEIETSARVYSEGGNIIIDTPKRMTVTVSDAIGHTRQVDVVPGCNVIAAGNGVFIVNAGGKTTKLLLK